MRTPKPHRALDGTVTYRVRFRINGHETTETFGNLRDAKLFAADLEAARHNTALALRWLAEREQETRADALTLDALAEQFFGWKADRVRSDRTIADYRRDYTNWIKPELGHRPASKIMETDVQALVDGMHGRLSPKSINDRHAILFGIYQWGAASSRRLVLSNPCVDTELPKRRKTPPKGLRPAEWQALYAALRQVDDDGADLALFLLATGWRISEASALSAYDVEDDGASVWVTMGRVVRRNAAGQHVIVDDAKSDAGLRRVKLDHETADMVRRRLDRVQGDGLVFTTAGGAQWHTSNFTNRIWNRAVKAANLTRRPTPHSLRHTSVGWLILSGKASLPEIQRRIGHEHISTTIDVYGRLIEDVSDDALEAFAAMRGGDGREITSH